MGRFCGPTLPVLACFAIGLALGHTLACRGIDAQTERITGKLYVNSETSTSGGQRPGGLLLSKLPSCYGRLSVCKIAVFHELLLGSRVFTQSFRLRYLWTTCLLVCLMFRRNASIPRPKDRAASPCTVPVFVRIRIPIRLQ
jgi:hypothetical protein